MKNLNIGSRLGVGFAVVLLLLAALTVTALVRMQTASDLTYRLDPYQHQEPAHGGRMGQDHRNQQRARRGLV